MLPFVISFAVATLLENPIRKISRRLSLSKQFVSFISVLVFYTTVGTIITVICIKLFVWSGQLFANLPDFYSNTISPVLSVFFNWVNNIVSLFDNTLVNQYGMLLSDFELSLSSAISAISLEAINFISSIVTNLPMFVIEILLGIISTFFFSADYEYITHFIMSLIPENPRRKLTATKQCLVCILQKYSKSYLLIMLITFAELSFGLTIAQVKNPLATALVITILDILPVLGTGLVLVPWGIFNLITANYRTGVLLIAVYVIITIIRNIIEPKIVGKQVGIHPALTLVSIFVGTRLFGIVGLFALPLGLSLIKSLNDCGVINILTPYKDNPARSQKGKT